MTDASAPQRLAPTTDGGPVGPVMVIGGAEDKLGERVILSRFVELAGGDQAHIVVISTASSLGNAATDLYRHIFARIGVTNVTGLRPETREDANDILDVIGRGSVTIVDGSDVITDAFQTTGHKPMMVSNARLHSLPSGYRFDLRARRVLPLDDSKRERIAQLAQGRIARMVRQAAADGRDDRALERRRARHEDQKASE